MQFNLSEQHASYILNALAQRPYVEVFELIADMQAQAVVQAQTAKQPGAQEPIQAAKPRARRSKVTPIKANGHDTGAAPGEALSA